MRAILFFFAAFLFQTTFGQQPTRYLIKAGKFFDSEKKQFLRDQYIVVEGDKVVKVGKSADGFKANSQFIDLSSATVIPGLIDSHTHFLFMQKSGTPMETDLIENSDADRLLRGGSIAQSFLEAGITTVKDLGNSGPYLDVVLRNAIRKGWVKGARMLVSGPIISPPNGQFGKLAYLHKTLPAREYSIVRTVDEARSAVNEHIVNGVDLIKICATNDNGLVLSPEQMRAIVEVAHQNGLKVTAHATYDEIIRDAVQAGVDGIEHGYGISDSTLRLMAQKGTYLVPTDGSFEGYKGIVEFAKSNITDDDIRSFVATTKERLVRAVKAGVKIVYGSDLYLYTPRAIGLEAKNTLVSYVDAGLPVADVLQAGTYQAAVVMGKQKELGVIKEGALADIVAFSGDLEKDFKEVIYNRVQFVMKDGVVYKHVTR
ncbi:amidohydrolase family protein [Rudanella lutea]|uniref:amidohydrolase family protein n=1 Tax=Rudanella lutea TaxID=451374 RepID=UPI0005C4A4FD|nr:amidohydrolase family protein [Rudanella lutea]